MENIQSNRERMSFLVTRIEGIGVIAPEREVDTENAVQLEAAFIEAYAQAGPVVIDLDAFENIPPHALLAIKRWALRFAADRRSFGVCTSSRTIRLALMGHGLGQTLVIFPNLSAAIQVVRPGARAPLGEILQRRFGISRQSVIAALRHQKHDGGLLGHILLVQRAIRPMELAEALAVQEGTA